MPRSALSKAGQEASKARAFKKVRRTITHTLPRNAYIPGTEDLTYGEDASEPPAANDGYPILPRSMRCVAVKDNIVTTSSTTTCASQTLNKYCSPFEATVISSLRHEGGSVNVKTNLDEFGMGSHSTNSYFGVVTNGAPYEDISVGGSSGGSAVAVATDKYKWALGTDTGGSVRLPAAYNGIIGFKPSYGSISRWGVIPYANSLDTVGIMARNCAQIEKAYQALSVPDSKDPSALTAGTRARIRRLMHRKSDEVYKERVAEIGATPEGRSDLLRNLRIGIPMEYNIGELKPVVRFVWQTVLALLQAKGATLVPINLPNTKHALSAYYILAPAEAASNLSKYDGVRYGTRHTSADGNGQVLYSETRGQNFGSEVQRRILLGSYTLSSEARDNYFLKAQKIRRLVQQDFDRAFALPNPLRPEEQFDLSDMDESISMETKLGPAQVDVIVCPTAPTRAPSLSYIQGQGPLASYVNDVFTVPASLAGLPALSLPFSIPPRYKKKSHTNFVGMQVIGQFGDDHRVLRVSRAFEELRDKHRMLEMGKYADKNEWDDATKAFAYAPIRKFPSNKGSFSGPQPDDDINQELDDALALWAKLGDEPESYGS